MGIQFRALMGLVSAGAMCASAAAGPLYTTINPPAPGELGHADILAGIYGGSFSASGVDFIGSGASAGVMAIRIEDSSPGGFLNLRLGGPGVADDRIWNDGFARAAARARYAGFSQEFGYFMNPSGGAFESLFSVTGSGFGVTGEAMMDFSGAEWRWARNGPMGPQTSNDGDNPDGLDHMVTYQMTGLNNDFATTWLLFWEDRNAPTSDRDFNDLVVEIGAVVPLPSAAGLGVLGLVGVMGVRRRRTV